MFSSKSCSDWSPVYPNCLFSFCDTNLKHMIHFWKALGLCFKNLQKICKFSKFQIFFVIKSFLAKKPAKTKNSQNIKNTILKSPWHGKFTYANIFSNFSKTENVQLFCAKMYKKCFFCKNCEICFYLFKTFQKTIKCQIQWPEVGLNIDLVE